MVCMEQNDNRKTGFSAGIVLFHPEKKRLFKNVDIINAEVDNIYIYNNGADKSIIEELIKNAKVIMLGDGKNIGIASAMNRIFEAAKKNNDEWLVTFDQDSISDNELIREYKRIIGFYPKAAIFCPQVIDSRRKFTKPVNSKKIEKVDRCITSASCTRINAWDDVDGFDDFLFIDLVDNDFCKKLVIKKWKIYKLNSVILDQEFGDIQLKDEKTVKRIIGISEFVRNKLKLTYLADNIGKLSYRKKVNPMRVYYSNRNIIYLNKKYCNYGGIGYDSYRCKSYLGFLIVFNLASFLRGRDKKRIFSAIIHGIRDGRKSRVKPMP